MICQEVMELMQRYIDGDLNQQETSLMMDHVGQCPDCSAMLTKLQRLSSELEQLPRVVPRYSLVDAILPELDRLVAAQSDSVHNEQIITDSVPAAMNRSSRPRRNLFRRLSGFVAAGIVAGLLIISQPQNWSFTGGSSNDEAAAPTPVEAQAKSSADQFSTRLMISATAEASDGMENNKRVEGAAGNQATELVPEASTAPRSEESAPAPESDGQFNSKDQYGDEVDKSDSASGRGEQETGGIMSTENPEPPPVFNKDAASPSITFQQAIPAETSVSPDEKWRAIAVEGSGTIQVYKTEDESEWFQSEIREGRISLLSWNEDSSLLYYTYTDAEGRQTQYVFDVVNIVESIR